MGYRLVVPVCKNSMHRETASQCKEKARTSYSDAKQYTKLSEAARLAGDTQDAVTLERLAWLSKWMERWWKNQSDDYHLLSVGRRPQWGLLAAAVTDPNWERIQWAHENAILAFYDAERYRWLRSEDLRENPETASASSWERMAARREAVAVTRMKHVEQLLAVVGPPFSTTTFARMIYEDRDALRRLGLLGE